MTYRKGDVFVPNGDSRRETAIMLVGAAAEYGLPDDSVYATRSGFFITDDLADVLYEEDSITETEPVPEPEPTKTSGNRAAKNKAQNSDKGE